MSDDWVNLSNSANPLLLASDKAMCLKVWLEPDTKGGIDAPKRTDDAGFDLRAAGQVVLHPGESATIRTGVHVELPVGTCALVIGRSGNNTSGALGVVGLIDQGYRGEIRVVLNYADSGSNGDYRVIREGERVAQLLIVPYLAPALAFVESLTDLAPSERDQQGFGSTGKA